jgi:hypothetical protein
LSALLLSGVALGGATACAGDDGAPTDGVPAAESNSATPAGSSGSLSFALTVPPDLSFQQFTYAITGPNYAKAAAIDVSRSSTISALIGDLPVGAYSVTLVGTSVDQAVSCSGAASFTIAAGAQTTVPIEVSCHVQNPAVASVPVPESSSVALGFLLLAVGTVAVRRRSRAA